MPNRIRVLIADHHALFLRELRRMLDHRTYSNFRRFQVDTVFEIK